MAPLPPPWIPPDISYHYHSASGFWETPIQSSLMITNQPPFSICGTLIMEQFSCTSAYSLFLCQVTSVSCITWLWSSTPFWYYVAASFILVLTLIFSPNVFLYSHLSSTDCFHGFWPAGVWKSQMWWVLVFQLILYLLTYLPASRCCCHFITMVVILLLIPVPVLRCY